MLILGKTKISKFINKHRDAKKPLYRWVKIAEASNWGNFNDIKKTFAHADLFAQKKVRYVIFNIAGNKYRLVTAINFKGQMAIVKVIMTHGEYSKNKWKDTL
jgi:mRNA interferase HigB